MVPCGSSPVTRFALAFAMQKSKRGGGCLIRANHHGIAIGHMNVQSRVGVRRASGLKWVLSETCSEEYMTKKAVKMGDLTHVSYSLLSSGS